MYRSFLFIAVAVTLFPVGSAAAENTPSDVGQGRQPQVAVTSTRAFIAYAKDGAIYCVSSPDGGKTFGAPVKVAQPANMPVGMRRGPRIAATETAVVITAIQRPSGRDGDLVAWRSTDEGKTWSPVAKPLNTQPGAAREGLHGMAAGPGGAMFCVWLDLRNTPSSHGHGGNTELWGARSSDGGATWSPDALLYRSPQKSVCQCCHPSVAYSAEGKSVAVMFRNELAGNRDMYVMESRDGGRTFSPAKKLGVGTWELNACPMDGGMITYPGFGQEREGGAGAAAPVTAWRRAGEVFISRPGEREQKVGNGQQPWVTSRGSVSVVAWISGRPGRLLVRWGDEQPITVADRASDPSIAASPTGRGAVLAAWESNGRVMAQAVPHQ